MRHSEAKGQMVKVIWALYSIPKSVRVGNLNTLKGLDLSDLPKTTLEICAGT